MLSRKDEKGMICFLTGPSDKSKHCVEKTDQMLHWITAADIVSRVLQKCRLIDQAFLRQGFNASAEKALKGQMKPGAKVCRNGRLCLELEDVIDGMLEAVKAGVPGSKILQAMQGLVETKPTKK